MNLKQAFRAAVSFGLGVFVTFNQAHGPDTGLWVLGIFGIVLGIGLGALTLTKKADLSALQELPVAVLAMLVGLFSFLALAKQETQLPAFLALVSAWGLISGAFELYQARRSSFKSQEGKDFLISAIFGLLLGLLFLAVQLDSVSAVGFFGAYLAMSGVHLGIAAASSKKPK